MILVGNKIWYELENTHNYPYLDNIIWITNSNFSDNQDIIQQSIDSFNSNIEWDEMWDMKEAKQRLDNGHDLYIGYDNEGPLSHVWFQNDFLYNMFTNPRRPEGYSKQFIEGVFNFIPYDIITLCVDDWNIQAQKFWEKLSI